MGNNPVNATDPNGGQINYLRATQGQINAGNAGISGLRYSQAMDAALQADAQYRAELAALKSTITGVQNKINHSMATLEEIISYNLAVYELRGFYHKYNQDNMNAYTDITGEEKQFTKSISGEGRAAGLWSNATGIDDDNYTLSVWSNITNDNSDQIMTWVDGTLQWAYAPPPMQRGLIVYMDDPNLKDIVNVGALAMGWDIVKGSSMEEIEQTLIEEYGNERGIFDNGVIMLHSTGSNEGPWGIWMDCTVKDPNAGASNFIKSQSGLLYNTEQVDALTGVCEFFKNDAVILMNACNVGSNIELSKEVADVMIGNTDRTIYFLTAHAYIGNHGGYIDGDKNRPTTIAPVFTSNFVLQNTEDASSSGYHKYQRGLDGAIHRGNTSFNFRCGSYGGFQSYLIGFDPGRAYNKTCIP